MLLYNEDVLDIADAGFYIQQQGLEEGIKMHHEARGRWYTSPYIRDPWTVSKMIKTMMVWEEY